jgi:cbb3-type cytochrome oxidase subunit 3
MFKKLFALSSIVFFCLSILSLPSLVLADDAIETNYGLNTTIAVSNATKSLNKTSPTILAGNIVGAILSFIGVIFFILIVYGGFRWMLSEGNDEEVKKAQGIITAAIIGLIIVLGAYAITSFIGQVLTKS